MRGNGWADTMSGGPGNDNVNGGLADDVLFGGPGSDQLRGSNGTNTCFDLDADTVHGGCDINNFDQWPA
jgi:Ca2+-binding RTX toxin-like protein